MVCLNGAVQSLQQHLAGHRGFRPACSYRSSWLQSASYTASQVAYENARSHQISKARKPFPKRSDLVHREPCCAFSNNSTELAKTDHRPFARHCKDSVGLSLRLVESKSAAGKSHSGTRSEGTRASDTECFEQCLSSTEIKKRQHSGFEYQGVQAVLAGFGTQRSLCLTCQQIGASLLCAAP